MIWLRLAPVSDNLLAGRNQKRAVTMIRVGRPAITDTVVACGDTHKMERDDHNMIVIRKGDEILAQTKNLGLFLKQVDLMVKADEPPLQVRIQKANNSKICFVKVLFRGGASSVINFTDVLNAVEWLFMNVQDQWGVKSSFHDVTGGAPVRGKINASFATRWMV